MQWLASLIMNFLLEKVWGLLSKAFSLMKKQKEDQAKVDENSKDLEEAKKGGNDESEAKASEDLLNNS